MYKYFVTFLIFCLCFSAVNAQETVRSKEDLKNMLLEVNSNYLKAGSQHTSVRYTTEMWKGRTTAANEISNAEFAVDGVNNYAKQEDMEVLRNAEYQLFADHDRKVLVVEKRLTPSWTQLPFANLDSLLNNCDKVTLLEKDGQKIWSLEFSGISITQLTIHLDNQGKRINSLRMSFDQDNSPVKKVTLDISYSTLSAKEASGYFNIEKFVKIDAKGKVKPVGKYMNYKLLTPEVRL